MTPDETINHIEQKLEEFYKWVLHDFTNIPTRVEYQLLALRARTGLAVAVTKQEKVMRKYNPDRT